MATNAGVLKGLIKAELLQISAAGEQAIDDTALDQFSEAIANAVVEHIKDAATVTVTGGSSAGTYPVE